MRRPLSILLVLLYLAGPPAFALGSSDDTALPACCRRHGAHHCAAMASVEGATENTSNAIVKAPSRCPQFPQHANARTSSYAAVSYGTHVPEAIAYETGSFGYSATGRISICLRIPVLRGPPAIHLD